MANDKATTTHHKQCDQRLTQSDYGTSNIPTIKEIAYTGQDFKHKIFFCIESQNNILNKIQMHRTSNTVIISNCSMLVKIFDYIKIYIQKLKCVW